MSCTLVTWNSSPYDAAQLLSPANSLVAPTARPHLENVMSAVGWPQAGTTCGPKPRSHQKSHRGKLMLSLHSDWWVLGPTLPGEIRYLFLTKHGVPIRLILLMAPALQHLTRPYPRTLPLARLTPRTTSFFCEPHCCSSRCNVQAAVPTRPWLTSRPCTCSPACGLTSEWRAPSALCLMGLDAHCSRCY